MQIVSESSLQRSPQRKSSGSDDDHSNDLSMMQNVEGVENEQVDEQSSPPPVPAEVLHRSFISSH